MELHVLHQLGWSIRALAREYGLNWRTVKREVTSHQPRNYGPWAYSTALTEPQLRHVERRLAVCPRIRGTDLQRELCHDYQYTGSYPSFARQLRRLRPPPAREPVIRFETDPGEQTQADWAQLGVWPLGDGTAELSAMVIILGYSRAPAIRFAIDRTRATTLAYPAPLATSGGNIDQQLHTENA
jgi:transposase